MTTTRHQRRPTSQWIGRQAALLLWAAAAAIHLGGCAGPAKSSTRHAPELYSFWPQFPAEPRVQFLVSYRYSEDIEPPKSGLDELIYGKERRVLPINKPYGVQMSDGKIYICDTRNAAVVVLDLRRQQTRVMGVTGAGRLTSPTDIAIAPDGMKYVTDLKRGVVFVYDADERHVASFGSEGFKPTGIAVHGDELYVCDFASQQVHVLDRFTGQRLRSIGERGDQDGQFVRPLGVAVDRVGNVYVTDVIRCRVQRFSPGGRLVGAFGTIGDTLGSFVRPKHVAVDGDGIVYVVDASFQNVQMFDENNQLLMFFGAAGGHVGSMYLPAGVCVHDDDLDLFSDYVHPDFQAQRLVLVTNQFGRNKVAVYALGRLREGKTPRDLVPSLAPMRPGVVEEGVKNLLDKQGQSPQDAGDTPPVDTPNEREE